MKLKYKKVLGKTVGWELLMSHKETHRISDAGATAATMPGIPPKIRLIVKAVATGLAAICKIGGHDGIKIVWTIVFPYPIVLPR